MTTSLYDVQTKYLPRLSRPMPIFFICEVICFGLDSFLFIADEMYFSVPKWETVLVGRSRFPQQIDNLRLTYRLRDKLLRRENCSILIVKHILAFHYFTETHRSTFATSFWESITL